MGSGSLTNAQARCSNEGWGGERCDLGDDVGAEESAVDTREEVVGVGEERDGAVGLYALFASRVGAHHRDLVQCFLEGFALPPTMPAVGKPVLERPQRVGAVLGSVAVPGLGTDRRAGEAPTTGIALQGTHDQCEVTNQPCQTSSCCLRAVHVAPFALALRPVLLVCTHTSGGPDRIVRVGRAPAVE